jgi:hypothetical protein
VRGNVAVVLGKISRVGRRKNFIRFHGRRVKNLIRLIRLEGRDEKLD